MNTAFVHKYWGRSEVMRKMIALGRVSDSDLLFLIPNNVKKMHGLPLTRVAAKRKSVYKWRRKKQVSRQLFIGIIEEAIKEMSPEDCNDILGIEVN